ncbi:MAG: DUF3857 domain-containing protein, partial [Elusimicrobiaceae bacterium]|nr:DUF3857 domain-containing protein [Elusimicrobiaceae bacterium]
MKLFAVTAVVMLLSPPGRAEIIVLRSGEDITARVSLISSCTVKLENGTQLPRKDILEIQLAGQSAPQAAAIAVTERDKADAAAAFGQAREFGARYSGMNGLILLDSGEYVLKPDGTQVFRNHQIRQILKESLKQQWGTVGSCAEEGRERVRITKASVYAPDGAVYPLDPARIETSRPQDGSGDFFVAGNICSIYEMPNVQAGSIVDYETELETYNPFRRDFFFPGWGFADDQGPVRVSQVRVTVPASQDFFYSTRNFPAPAPEQPAVTRASETRTYSWRLENIEPLAAEPNMPAYQNVAPFLLGSLFKNWGPVLDWTAGLYEERTKPSPELARFTLDLVKNCKTEDEKAAEIYHYVQKEIRYIALKVGVASGWGGYDANLTWKRRYGCCVDKALLLTAMLNAAGIKASPVLINTNDQAELDFRIPQLGFDHCITVAEISGRHVFLDSTGYDYRSPSIAGFDYGTVVLNIFGHKL